MQESQETWVSPLGQEDPLENGMATTLVFLLGEFHACIEEPGGPQSMGRRESDKTEWLTLYVRGLVLLINSILEFNQLWIRNLNSDVMLVISINAFMGRIAWLI